MSENKSNKGHLLTLRFIESKKYNKENFCISKHIKIETKNLSQDSPEQATELNGETVLIYYQLPTVHQQNYR